VRDTVAPEIIGPLTVLLEAATTQNKDRTFVITTACTDQSGNHSKEKTTVIVSHLPQTEGRCDDADAFDGETSNNQRLLPRR
jgi:hypothetical protein